MKEAKKYALAAYDFIKGAALAFIVITLQVIDSSIKTGFPSTKGEWYSIAILAFKAFVAYMIKQYLTNSQGKLLGKEGEPVKINS